MLRSYYQPKSISSVMLLSTLLCLWIPKIHPSGKNDRDAGVMLYFNNNEKYKLEKKLACISRHIEQEIKDHENSNDNKNDHVSITIPCDKQYFMTYLFDYFDLIESVLNFVGGSEAIDTLCKLLENPLDKNPTINDFKNIIMATHIAYFLEIPLLYQATILTIARNIDTPFIEQYVYALDKKIQADIKEKEDYLQDSSDGYSSEEEEVQPFKLLTMALSHDNEYIYYGGTHKSVGSLNLSDGTLKKVPTENLEIVLSLATGNTSNIIAASDTNEKIHIGSPSKKLTRVNNNSDIRSLIFSDDDTKLILGGENFTVTTYNVKTNRVIRPLNVHSGACNRVLSLRQNDNLIASGSDDETVKISDFRVDKNSTVATLYGHEDSVLSLYQTGEHTLLSGGKDQHVFVWDLRKKQSIKEIQYTQKPSDIKPEPTRSRLPSHITPLAANPLWVNDIAITTDKQTVLCALGDGAVSTINIADYNPGDVYECSSQGINTVISIKNSFATASDTGNLKFYDL